MLILHGNSAGNRTVRFTIDTLASTIVSAYMRGTMKELPIAKTSRPTAQT